jgi:ubiquinone/menaquinone biosynthesis C-methylase UbiE
MTSKHNPQAEQMADESMMRNLKAQAITIWPQEEPLFDRYDLPAKCRILDVGCGTGEISSRLAEKYPRATVIAVDLLNSSLDIGRIRYQHLVPRLEFMQQDAFKLDFEPHSFDLVVCRHMLQAVPRPVSALAGFVRLLKKDGWLHLISEDYGMLQMQHGKLNPDRLWHAGVLQLLENTGTDGRIGRNTYTMLYRLGMQDIQIDYAVIDTLRVEREDFANIMTAWRDGYTETISKNTALSKKEVKDTFQQIISDILNPEKYAVWHVPIIGARAPG